ncbi:Transcriptional repressor rco-1 [Leucoagaricus sp. SymC.cos]|nr:Transcriptional repressor rco-1 [Leucoagaricus sp. SymC.cos]
MAHPSPPRQHPSAPPPLHLSRRLSDALQIIQEEYNRILAERDALRTELTRTQNIANEQDMELNMIRRAIWNLQNQLETHRQRFEDERQRLFDELRYQRAVAGLAPPTPLRDLSNPPMGPPLSASVSATSSNSSSSSAASFAPIQTPSPEVDLSVGGGGRGFKHVQPQPPSRRPTPLPPIVPNTHTHTPAGDDLLLSLNPANAPPGYRKEHNDWAVTFNPKLPRNLDVDLVQSIPHPSVVCSIHISPDGQYVATGCNQAVYIYEIKSGVQVCSLVDPSCSRDGDLYIRSVKFSPCGEYLATGAEDHRVRIWTIKPPTLRYVFSGHRKEVCALDYSPNGRYVISGSGDCTAVIWDLKRGGQTTTAAASLDTPESGITSISIDSSTTYVAAGCLDRLIRIWNIHTGELVAKLKGHEDSVYTVRFMTPPSSSAGIGESGRWWLVSAGLDCYVRCWDVSALLLLSTTVGDGVSGGEERMERERGLVSCPLVRSLRGHQDYVLTVAYSSDNRYIISGAKDRSLVLWDSVEGIGKLKVNGHTNSVISVDIRGTYVVTASGDRCCRICEFIFVHCP